MYIDHNAYQFGLPGPEVKAEADLKTSCLLRSLPNYLRSDHLFQSSIYWTKSMTVASSPPLTGTSSPTGDSTTGYLLLTIQHAMVKQVSNVSDILDFESS